MHVILHKARKHFSELSFFNSHKYILQSFAMFSCKIAPTKTKKVFVLFCLYVLILDILYKK